MFFILSPSILLLRQLADTEGLFSVFLLIKVNKKGLTFINHIKPCNKVNNCEPSVCCHPENLGLSWLSGFYSVFKTLFSRACSKKIFRLIYSRKKSDQPPLPRLRTTSLPFLPFRNCRTCNYFHFLHSSCFYFCRSW
jgi:hypothetical protein